MSFLFRDKSINKKARESAYAVFLALIIGIFSIGDRSQIFGLFLLALVIYGVVNGHKALKELRANPTQKGKGYARFGIILGWFIISINIILIILRLFL